MFYCSFTFFHLTLQTFFPLTHAYESFSHSTLSIICYQHNTKALLEQDYANLSLAQNILHANAAL